MMNKFNSAFSSTGAVVSAVLGISLLLGACSSTPLDQAGSPIESRSGTQITDLGKANPSASQGGAAGAATGSSGSQIQTVTLPSKDELNDPNSPLAKRSIFFEYDSFSIKDEYRTTVEAHAKYLLAEKARKVVIQGNTDDRGSREYNLALGQKRADTVRKALAVLGVPEAQMEAVSFGEEKLRNQSADEKAQAENRRADFAY
jgi:peptidoglycan-associated lipoprotein